MFAKKYRERLQALFADIERLAVMPAADQPGVRGELEALRARLLELEAEFRESEKQTAVSAAPAGARILFDRDKVGFSYAGGGSEVIQDQNAALTSIENSIKALLVASGRPIGELQIEPPSDHPLSPDDLNLTNSVAQQASLQIQNLRLLAAAERARAEAESATRRFTRQGWDSYLDAINKHERLGFAYDRGAVTSYTGQVPLNSGFHQPLDVLGESIGSLYLKTESDRPLSGDDQEMIQSVARQVSQQVENLRLLADAARARAEAEEATRRLTRETWEVYAAEAEEQKPQLAFAYDSGQVAPLTDTSPSAEVSLVQPLTVNGEPIGQLAVGGGAEFTPEAASLAASVAAQVSIHLETLRLNEELRKRAAELVELDRLKSTFLANMSHELRTPLNSILGFADVILEELDGPLTENMNNDVRLIQKNGQHLLHLINDVLDMAKITAGRMNISLERFKVQELFEEVMDITSPLAGEKSLALVVDKDSDKKVEVNADRTRIKQVMINVVNNAIKFTEKGKIRMRVVQQGDSVLITVRDKGIGIPADNLDAIFQEFTQVDSSTTRKAGGTGLGLPISRRLIEMHGGRMWAESSGAAGEGSTFYVELPIEAKLSEPVEKREK